MLHYFLPNTSSSSWLSGSHAFGQMQWWQVSSKHYRLAHVIKSFSSTRSDHCRYLFKVFPEKQSSRSWCSGPSVSGVCGLKRESEFTRSICWSSIRSASHRRYCVIKVWQISPFIRSQNALQQTMIHLSDIWSIKHAWGVIYSEHISLPLLLCVGSAVRLFMSFNRIPFYRFFLAIASPEILHPVAAW